MTLTVCKLLDVTPSRSFMIEILSRRTSEAPGNAHRLSAQHHDRLGSRIPALSTSSQRCARRGDYPCRDPRCVFYALYGRKMNVGRRAQLPPASSWSWTSTRRSRTEWLPKQSVVMTALVVAGSWRMARWGWNRALSRQALRHHHADLGRKHREALSVEDHAVVLFAGACSSSWARWPRPASSACWRTG